MTKGKDVKQLYSKLGLQPTDYQEVRADQEVMRSIEERWPLLRDLLGSLASSLGPQAGAVAPVVSHVADAPEPAATAAPQPATAQAVSPQAESSAPPAPAWLQPAAAPQPEAPDLPPPPAKVRASEDRSDAPGSESLAARLERLYGDSAAVDDAAPSGEGDLLEPVDEKVSVDLPDPTMADFEDSFSDLDDEPPAKPAAPARKSGPSLLGKLLSRPLVPEAPDPADSADLLEEIPAPPEPSSDWTFSTAAEHGSEDAPPAIDEPASKPIETVEPDISGLIHRLTAGESTPPAADAPKPRKDLQSMFARLKQGGGK